MRPRLRVSPLSEEGGPGQMFGTSRLGRAWGSRFTLRKEGSQWGWSVCRDTFWDLGDDEVILPALAGTRAEGTVS